VIAALFVDPKGIYPTLAGVDCWPESRNAMGYYGPNPVVAHPPCNVWCCLAKANQARYGIPWGVDGGMFKRALVFVNFWGGVLEHPAKSLAWPVFGLVKPVRGCWTPSGQGWVTEVSQVAYGHPCRKRTWLYYSGKAKPEDLDWSEPEATHQISKDRRLIQKPTLPARLTHITPPAFAAALIRLAEGSR
jgi:hypothetical protein